MRTTCDKGPSSSCGHGPSACAGGCGVCSLPASVTWRLMLVGTVDPVAAFLPATWRPVPWLCCNHHPSLEVGTPAVFWFQRFCY